MQRMGGQQLTKRSGWDVQGRNGGSQRARRGAASSACAEYGWEQLRRTAVTEDDLKTAINNQTLFLTASLRGQALYVALNHRLHEISGMLELALLQKAAFSFIDVIVHERNFVRDRIDEIASDPSHGLVED
jgi:hypothetical protein